MIFYGVLDLVLGPLFLYYYLFRLRAIDYETLGIHSGKYSDGPRNRTADSATAAATGNVGQGMTGATNGTSGAPVTQGLAGRGMGSTGV